jgi:hypothetical protein
MDAMRQSDQAQIKSQLTSLLQNRQDGPAEVPLDLALVAVPQQHGMLKESMLPKQARVLTAVDEPVSSYPEFLPRKEISEEMVKPMAGSASRDQIRTSVAILNEEKKGKTDQ